MPRNSLLLALLCWAPLPAGAAAPAAPKALEAARDLAKLSTDYWDWAMARDPLWATFIRHPGRDDRLADPSAEGRRKELADIDRLAKRLSAVDPAALDEGDRVSWEILRLQLDTGRQWHEHKFWQWDVDHMDGPQSWIMSVVEVAQPMATEKDVQALLARMAAFGPFFDAHLANLREGLAEGRLASRVAAEKTISQLKDLIAKPAHESSFATAAKRLPAGLQDRYLPEVLRAAEAGPKPALEKYLRFLETEYLPRARLDPMGLSGLAGGEAAYRFQIRRHTTLDKTPEELHRTGLDELEAIHAEMAEIARRLGHVGAVSSFMEKVRKDPVNFFKTREEIVEAAKALVARTRERLPEFFGRLPKTPLEVRRIEDYQEKNDAAARYYSPPDDLSRPGIYYINTYEPGSRPRFGMAALAAHEGLPGHHLQIALAVESGDLPAFRRHGGFNAFVEGWALYSERLADEMGLYPDDLSRLGMLMAQALRACRLVVDTGLHAKAWSRQKAVDFMKENTPMSEGEIAAEVDRYIIWPGQALAYKVGQREIAAIRKEAEARQGRAFDLRAFHDAVLRPGAVPLPTLRRLVLGGE
ncbi:MAG: DUF885 domain-containing protein [Elusimicrobia bacterium]|nr:DUF885 domain-containing protein [Elusimicrobiota bacterium]